jgi:hypothetical protein
MAKKGDYKRATERIFEELDVEDVLGVNTKDDLVKLIFSSGLENKKNLIRVVEKGFSEPIKVNGEVEVESLFDIVKELQKKREDELARMAPEAVKAVNREFDKQILASEEPSKKTSFQGVSGGVTGVLSRRRGMSLEEREEWVKGVLPLVKNKERVLGEWLTYDEKERFKSDNPSLVK